MILYQLAARGPLKHFGDSGSIHSKRVFRTREAATGYMAEFSVLCTTDRDDARSLGTLESIRYLTIVELELPDA